MQALPVVCVYVILLGVWSSTWIVIKAGLHGAPPLIGAGTRFLSAGMVLAAFQIATRRPLRVERRHRRLVGITALSVFALPLRVRLHGRDPGHGRPRCRAVVDAAPVLGGDLEPAARGRAADTAEAARDRHRPRRPRDHLPRQPRRARRAAAGSRWSAWSRRLRRGPSDASSAGGMRRRCRARSCWPGRWALPALPSSSPAWPSSRATSRSTRGTLV